MVGEPSSASSASSSLGGIVDGRERVEIELLHVVADTPARAIGRW